MIRSQLRGNRRHPGPATLIGSALCLLAAGVAPAAPQQFNSDNQWVAPHGVATIIPTVSQEYSLFQLVAALLPETEFNLGVIRYWEESQNRSEAHTTGSFYIKRRLAENAAGTGGWAVMGGTGVDPSIPWRQIVCTRNRLIHGYDAVDHDILWGIVDRELPVLLSQLEEVLTQVIGKQS